MLTWSGDTGLATLFLSAFVSATVLPGNSEVVLAAVLKSFPERAAAAIALATLGNTLGSLTTFGLGRLLPQRPVEGRAVAWVRRYGALTLLLAWLPLVGDALCAAAGWLRVPWLLAAAVIAAGKLLRYLAVAQAVALF
jgi:membrane protein YqaA with SNARE-associated domain